MKNPKDVQKFCKRIKELRKEAGLTQDALAFESGVARRTVQKIEAGEQAVTVDVLFSLARAMQVQPSVFFEGFTIKIEE